MSKKDRDSDGSAASPFGNAASSGSLGVQTANPNASAPATQASAISASEPANSAQVAAAGMEGKPFTNTASSKTADTAAKGLGQAPAGIADAEASADAAARVSSSLQATKLVERAGQTEMRVGIQAGELGNVDIRTSMGRNQFTAEISVERAELGRALTADLPALHDRLQEQRVPLANIILQERSDGGSSGDPRQAPRQQPPPAFHVSPAGDAETEPLMAVEMMEASRGLDIHI